MNKELHDILTKIRTSALNKQTLTLSKREVHLLLKYINELETELAGDPDEL